RPSDLLGGDPGGARDPLVDHSGADPPRAEERAARGGDRGRLPLPAPRTARLVAGSYPARLGPAARRVPHLSGGGSGAREPGDGAGVRRVVPTHPSDDAAGRGAHPPRRGRVRGLRAAEGRAAALREAPQRMKASPSPSDSIGSPDSNHWSMPPPTLIASNPLAFSHCAT